MYAFFIWFRSHKSVKSGSEVHRNRFMAKAVPTEMKSRQLLQLLSESRVRTSFVATLVSFATAANGPLARCVLRRSRFMAGRAPMTPRICQWRSLSVTRICSIMNFDSTRLGNLDQMSRLSKRWGSASR